MCQMITYFRARRIKHKRDPERNPWRCKKIGDELHIFAYQFRGILRNSTPRWSWCFPSQDNRKPVCGVFLNISSNSW